MRGMSSDVSYLDELEDVDWDGITVIEVDTQEYRPRRLPPTHEVFNPDDICSKRHLCATCRELGRPSSCCIGHVNDKILSNKPLPNAVLGEAETSFSPCSQSSLTAKPLPAPPPVRLLPRDLVETVHQHPEIFKIVTSLDIPVFEQLLKHHPNQPFVRSVVNGFRLGFWPFAAIPYPLTVNESYHSTRKPEYQNFLEEQRDKEIKAGRFSEAFGPRLLRGMTCMPVHVVKSAKKLRAIYDHSAGKYSLNSLIPEEARTVKLDGIKHLGHVLRRAHSNEKTRNIVLFKSDVSTAYRIMPMSPYWQALQAVRIDGKYYVDRCNTFGNAASQTIFCAFFSLVLWIAENVFGMCDMLSYIDDNFSWEYSNKMKHYGPYAKFLPEKQAKLLLLWDLLGIPHDAKKQEYGDVLKIIGYEIDVRKMHVKIPQEAMDEILSKIETLCATSTSDTDKKTLGPYRDFKPVVTVQYIRRMAGKVNWAIEVNPLLKPGVDGLHRLLVGRTEPTETCEVDDETRQDLLWLAAHLRSAKGSSLKSTMAWDAAEATQTVYACTSSRGIGFWSPTSKMGCRAPFASKLGSDHEITFHRLVAVICVVDWFQKRAASMTKDKKRLLIYVEQENDTVVTAFKTFRAPAGMNRIFRHAIGMLLRFGIDLHVEKTPEVDGEKADFARLLARQKTASPLSPRPEIRIREYKPSAELDEVLSDGVRVPDCQ